MRTQYSNIESQPGLPVDAAVVISYSPISLLVVPIATLILVAIPIFLSCHKLPATMVFVGTDSPAISSACHASCISEARLDTTAPEISRDGDGFHRETDSNDLLDALQTAGNICGIAMKCNRYEGRRIIARLYANLQSSEESSAILLPTGRVIEGTLSYIIHSL